MLDIPDFPIREDGRNTAGSSISGGLALPLPPLPPKLSAPMSASAWSEDPSMGSSDLYWAAMRSNSALETLSAVTVDQAAKLDVLNAKSKKLVKRLRALQYTVMHSHSDLKNSPASSNRSTSCPGSEGPFSPRSASAHSLNSSLLHKIESEIRAATAEAEAVVWMLSVCSTEPPTLTGSTATTFRTKPPLPHSAYSSDVGSLQYDQTIKSSIQEARAASELLKKVMSVSSVDSHHTSAAPIVHAGHFDWSELSRMHPSAPNSETWGTHSQAGSHYDTLTELDCCAASQASAEHNLADQEHGPYTSLAYAQLVLQESRKPVTSSTLLESEGEEEDDAVDGYSSSSDEEGDCWNDEYAGVELEDEGGPKEWFRSTMRTRSACAKKISPSPRVPLENHSVEVPAMSNPLWGTSSCGSEMEHLAALATAQVVAQRAVSDAPFQKPPLLQTPGDCCSHATFSPGPSKIPSVFGDSPQPSALPSPASTHPHTPQTPHTPSASRPASACASPTDRLTLYDRARLKMQAKKQDTPRSSSLGPVNSSSRDSIKGKHSTRAWVP